MLVQRMVVECDFRSEAYQEPVAGAALIAQGATGRWCEVMHVGPAELAEMVQCGSTVLTRQQAEAEVLRRGGAVDF